MAAHGIDRIHDSLGYLVLNEDGAVISSGGRLENDESTASKIIKLVYIAYKIPITSDKKDSLKRLSVVVDELVYAVTVSQHKIFISLRPFHSQDGAAVVT